VKFFNDARPHQGLGQGIPGSPAQTFGANVTAFPVLGGLHPTIAGRVVPRFSTDQHGSQYGAPPPLFEGRVTAARVFGHHNVLTVTP